MISTYNAIHEHVCDSETVCGWSAKPQGRSRSLPHLGSFGACVPETGLLADVSPPRSGAHSENLPVYGVPAKLNEYHTTKKDIAAGLEVNPQENFRIESEDIYEGSKNTIKNIEVIKGKKPPKVVPSVLLQNIDESMDSTDEINMFNTVFKTDRSDTMF